MPKACTTSALTLALSFSSAFNLYGEAAKTDTNNLISALSGTWKEDQTKRKIGSAPGLRFRTTASGGLEELRGPEAKPMVQPVKLDGKPYPMDGGNTMVWKQIDASNFERRTSLNGKPLSVRRIRVSNDGKTITEDMDRIAMDGYTEKRTAQYRRTGGNGQGLVGTWQLVTFRDSVPAEVKYEPAGPNAVKMTNRMGMTQTLFFDGKTSPIEGGNVIPGMRISAKPLGPNSIETTITREGVTVGRGQMVVSEGGKVLTVTSTAVGSDSGREPSVTVFRKQ